MNEEPGMKTDHESLLSEVRTALATALASVMPVAGEVDKDGAKDAWEPKKLTQAALEERSGVRKSTINKYLAARKEDDETINPDLGTICKLAAALNVPPAFLLMRASDWTKLAEAASDVARFLDSKPVRDAVNGLVRRSRTAEDFGYGALELAKTMSVLQVPAPENDQLPLIPKRWREKQEEVVLRSRLGILAMTALPPKLLLHRGGNSEDSFNETIAILCICALMGASNDVKE